MFTTPCARPPSNRPQRLRVAALAVAALAGASCHNLRQEPEEKTCLVLSVGGAKGVAHIGAIAALREEEVQIDCVYGNSMGAVIGGLYASAPSADLTKRYAALMAGYVRASEAEAKSRGLLGFLGGLGLLAISGGTLGWEMIAASAGAGLAFAATMERFDNRRFRAVYEQTTGAAEIERLPMAFATSHQERHGEGLELVVSTTGSLAAAVSASANNPFIWGDTDVRAGRALDPGADRVAATPVEDACRMYRPARLIVINVTGQRAFHSAAMDCEVQEVMVDLSKAKLGAEALMPGSKEFAALVKRGHDAVIAAEVE